MGSVIMVSKHLSLVLERLFLQTSARELTFSHASLNVKFFVGFQKWQYEEYVIQKVCFGYCGFIFVGGSIPLIQCKISFALFFLPVSCLFE